jgi:hypothetical protein
MFITNIKFLCFINIYLLDKIVIRNGEINEPNAAPIVNEPIKTPETNGTWEAEPNTLIIVESGIVDK